MHGSAALKRAFPGCSYAENGAGPDRCRGVGKLNADNRSVARENRKISVAEIDQGRVFFKHQGANRLKIRSR